MVKNREYVKEVFKFLRANPENGMEEYKTSAFLAEELKKCGYEVITEVGGATGVIGILDSKVPGPILGIRADMDALGYEIDGKIEYRHTCGHDANSAMVMAMAKEIMEKGIKKGKLYIIFQPAEEKLCGALSMIKSGLLKDMTEAVGIHLRPIDDTTSGHATPAIYHGSSSPIEINIKGKTAHGARPHLGVNAADIAVLIANAIKNIMPNPLVFHSIKVTKIHVPSTSMNIIPDEAAMTLDVRCHDNSEMQRVLGLIKIAVESSASFLGGSAEMIVHGTTVAAEYDDEMKKVASEAIEEVLGKEGLLPDMYNPGGEDFHFFTQEYKCKSTIIGLGSNAKPGLHHKDMEFEHDVMYDGVEILCKVAEKRLG